MNPGGWSVGDWARGLGPSEERLHRPMTSVPVAPGSQWAAEYDHLTGQAPDRAPCATGSGSPTGRGAPTASAPSGRHAAGTRDGELTVTQVRCWLAMQDALAIRRAEMRYAHALLAEAVRR